MKRTLVFGIIILLVMSCELIDDLDSNNFNDYGTIILFNVKNSTSNDIGMLNISLFNEKDIKIEANVIKQGQSAELFLEMKNASAVDGAYFLQYEKNGNIYEKEFGYYTNGFPLDEIVNIEITELGISYK